MKTELFPCPACKRQHALCYLVRADRKQVGVNCDDSGKTGRTRFVPIPKSTIDASDGFDEESLEGIPVFHTTTADKKAREHGNLQFILMNADARENLKDMPEPMRTIESDEAKANRLQIEIAQKVQAQKEITQQIEKLSRQRTGFENDERDLRRQLREVWTEPLELKA